MSWSRSRRRWQWASKAACRTGGKNATIEGTGRFSSLHGSVHGSETHTSTDEC
jgi:hypothetical protein